MKRKKSERLSYILSALNKSAGVSIHNLAVELEVSDMTIRRDLDELCSQGCTTVVQGVAILNRNQDGSSVVKTYSLPEERLIMAEAKHAIGRAASKLIEPNDTIVMDTGTTTECIFQYLPKDYPLTVVGYNMNILLACRERSNLELISAGGFYHKNTELFESTEGKDLISRICINKFFISAAGVNIHGNISCIEQHELLYKQAAIQGSLQRILLADSSKFGKTRACMFASLADMDIVITDAGISDEWLERFESFNLKYIIAT